MRIQVLPLPSIVKGDDVEEPFALIIDQWHEGASIQQDAQWKSFAYGCGARTILVTPQTVEVVDRYAEPATVEPEPDRDAPVVDALKRVIRDADPVVPPREFDTERALSALVTAHQVLDSVAKVRALRDVQGQQGTWNYDEYMRGMFNGLELALSVLEQERPPQYRPEPEDGYLCDRPTPDMTGPEYAPVPAEG